MLDFQGGITIKILICDDDKSYIADIQKHIEFFMEGKNISVQYDIYDSGEPLLTSTEFYDMAFLDVEINGINGIDIGKVLKKNNENMNSKGYMPIHNSIILIAKLWKQSKCPLIGEG